MRTWWLCLLAPVIAGAQFPPPRLTGVLLERDAGASGEFALRANDNHVFRYQYDARTSVERDTFSGSVSWLKPGDKLVVESDTVSASLLRYARIVRVVDRPAKIAAPEGRLPDPLMQDFERTPQTGNLTFAGVVSRFNSRCLVLRTRGGEQTLLIRRDTRYMSNGDTVEAAVLQPNMRVFVRAGKNFYDQVEAYQVIWGTILDPAQK